MSLRENKLLGDRNTSGLQLIQVNATRYLCSIKSSNVVAGFLKTVKQRRDFLSKRIIHFQRHVSVSRNRILNLGGGIEWIRIILAKRVITWYNSSTLLYTSRW